MEADQQQPGPRASIACVGGAVLDRKYRARAELVAATSNPVDGMTSHGGVARNVTENLARLGASVTFLSAVGVDEAGRTLLSGLRSVGVDASTVAVIPGRSTAEYVAVLDPRSDLAVGLADMAIFEELTPAVVDRLLPEVDWLFADCNPPAETMAFLVAQARAGRFRLALDTVSTPKALRLPRDLAGVSVLFTNLDEARALLGDPGIGQEAAASALCDRGVEAIVLTAGASGYVVATREGVERYPVVPASPIDITGAGDAMIAGSLFALLKGSAIGEATRSGALLAALTIESTSSVRGDLTPAMLDAAAERTTT